MKSWQKMPERFRKRCALYAIDTYLFILRHLLRIVVGMRSREEFYLFGVVMGGEDAVALCFDTKALSERLTQISTQQSYHALFLARTTYGDDDRLFQDQLQGLAGIAELQMMLTTSLLRNRRLKSLPDSWMENFARYIVTAITHKHPAFEDEREVRLVASPIVDVEAGDHRSSPRWASTAPSQSRLLMEVLSALKSVLIGPSPNQERTKDNVTTILAEYGRGNVNIRVSDIPFRSRADLK